MSDRLDDMFRQLRAASPDSRLDSLEDGVWARIDQRRRADAFSGRTLQVQLAVSAGLRNARRPMGGDERHAGAPV
jgi:hypothetical protein